MVKAAKQSSLLSKGIRWGFKREIALRLRSNL